MNYNYILYNYYNNISRNFPTLSTRALAARRSGCLPCMAHLNPVRRNGVASILHLVAGRFYVLGSKRAFLPGIEVLSLFFTFIPYFLQLQRPGFLSPLCLSVSLSTRHPPTHTNTQALIVTEHYICIKNRPPKLLHSEANQRPPLRHSLLNKDGILMHGNDARGTRGPGAMIHPESWRFGSAVKTST
jgi:hypothetical protein